MRKKHLLFLFIVSQILFSFSIKPVTEGEAKHLENIKEYKKIDLKKSGIKNPAKFIIEEDLFYVIDEFSETLFVLDKEGDLVKEIQEINSEKYRAKDIAVSFDHIYLLTDQGIMKFSKELSFNYIFSINLSTEDYYREPSAIAIDNYEDYYLTDIGSNSLLKIDASGEMLWQAGIFGQSLEALNGPLDVALGNDQSIYVIDNGNKRLKIYDQDQRVTDYIEGLHDPRAVVIDKKDNVFIADMGSRLVKIYQGNNLIGVIDKYDELNINPADITVSDKYFYILDSIKKQIYIYEIK